VSEIPGKLERRARALLRAYPAEYRNGRAEEIIGTLLEAAPPGRSFPPAREAWALIAGGRHARAARNRRPGVKANVRLALLLGIAIYLSFTAAANAFWPGLPPGYGVPWLAITTVAFCLALTLAPWLGSRVVTAALAIPAFTLVAYGDLRVAHPSGVVMSLAEFLVVSAALAALSGGPARLPRSWLLLPCVFPLTLVPEYLPSGWHFLSRGVESSLLLDATTLLAVVVVCWLVTDARPAFALGVGVLLQAVMTTLSVLALGGLPLTIQNMNFLLLLFAVTLPVLLPAAWLLLRRQKAPGPRPFPGP
jgi:hypothetical protein